MEGPMTVKIRYRNYLFIFALLTLASLFFAKAYAQVAPKDATELTKQMNEAVYGQLPFSDTQDFVDAKRGLIAPLPGGIIKSADGTVNWDLQSYAFLRAAKAPTRSIQVSGA
jgi:alkyl sulfatase BDS1-like metallo-beta-lactamase superfamily hydrolase